MPFLIIITLITAIEATNVFDLMLTLTGGGPFYATEVIDIFVYRQAFTLEHSSPGLRFGRRDLLRRLRRSSWPPCVRDVRWSSAPPARKGALIDFGMRGSSARLGPILTAGFWPRSASLDLSRSLWLLSASLKEPLEIFAKGLDLDPRQPLWENYARAWSTAGFAATCSIPSW